MPYISYLEEEEEDDDDMHKNFKNHMGVYKGRERGGKRDCCIFFAPSGTCEG